MVQVMRAPAQSQATTPPAPAQSTTPAPAQSQAAVEHIPVPRNVAPAPRRGPGRPSDYTEEAAAAICERLAMGQSLTKICAQPEMPSRGAVYNWLDKVEEFANRYARARVLRAAHYADEIVEIADDAENRSTEGIQAARLQVDARKWVAARMDPRMWGDRTAVEHSGQVTLEALVAGSLPAAPQLAAPDSEETSCSE
jgi:hypothetical protein